MNLTTTYMGFTLANPLIAGASPMGDNLDTVRRLEDSGASLFIMYSLFEEQIVQEQLAATRALEFGEESYAEATSYLPRPEAYRLGPEEYLEQIRKIKKAVSIPVIGSLNGTSEGGWLSYARLIQDAGADGLELNLYDLATDLDETGQTLENRALRVVEAVRKGVTIPVAVKISPFYSSIANFAKRLDKLGVDALVLFNRFYQPDIDVEQLEVIRVNLSSPSELLLRIRWVGILAGRIQASLAVTGGVHTVVDVVKAIMAGANGVQMVSALLQHGPAYLKRIRADLARWLEEHEYESLEQMRGSMSLLRCDNPRMYERANYMRILQSWDV
jgi:dihydroorotate dehydrogenase (fumarate)